MPKKTVPILVDGDQERLDELDRAVQVAARKAQAVALRAKASAGTPLRGGDEIPAEEITKAEASLQAAQDAFDAFLDEAAERAEDWILESIGHEEFRDLLKDNPIRTITTTKEDGSTSEEIDPEDKAWGVNTETLPKLLILFADPEDPDIRTVAEVKVGRTNIAKDPAALRKRVKRLSAGQFEKLFAEALLLNRAGVSDPKFNRFSPITPRSDET